MAVKNLALVSTVKQLPGADLERTVAALQIQLERDFEPIWNIQAKLRLFPNVHKIPKGWWPILIVKEIEAGYSSYHTVSNGIPNARISYADQWQLGVSHDMLEMLADPWCNRVVEGKAIKPGERGKVRYLVQICDPCSSPDYAYQIDGVTVSDFCTPDFFSDRPAEKYSFTGAAKKPLEILKGGYLSWIDPRTNHWWQKNWWGAKPEYRDLGAASESTTASLTDTPLADESKPPKKRMRRVPMQIVSLREDFLLVQRAENSEARKADRIIQELIARFGTIE